MNRFLPPGAYAQSSAPYELLPFNFAKLNDKETVLTNIAGEFLVLPSATVGALVDHTLSSDDPAFVSLRARHFIRLQSDLSPIELLALKVRTRYARLDHFTSLHIFVVTLRCEHSCPYCQVSRQSEDRELFDMTPAIADQALDLVFRSPSQSIKIEFQGGEPLLNFEMVRYVVERAERLNIAARRDLAFVIATNLALVTAEILEFCRQHDILISTSLDGPSELHNRNRPRPGKDSWERAVAGIHMARQMLGFDRVSALMTTTQSSLSFAREIIDTYLALGFTSIFLRPLSPYGFALKTKSFAAYNVNRWLDFYKKGLDYVLEINRAGMSFSEDYASLVLTKMLTSNDPGYVDLTNPAGIGLGAIVFNYDGGVYASDESRMLAEMGDTTLKLGDVRTSSYEDIYLSEPLLTALEDSFTLSAPMCSECAFEPFCGADPVYHHAVMHDFTGRKPSSDFCRRNMAVFHHLIHLMRSDKATEVIFRRWANRC
jgi:His-Xaa-Ser system radical SAM maturase HxsB